MRIYLILIFSNYLKTTTIHFIDSVRCVCACGGWSEVMFFLCSTTKIFCLINFSIKITTILRKFNLINSWIYSVGAICYEQVILLQIFSEILPLNNLLHLPTKCTYLFSVQLFYFSLFFALRMMHKLYVNYICFHSLFISLS